MAKFFPSNSAFMVGDLVVTKYNSGCLRSILIQSNGIRDGEIPEVYQRVGKAAEEQHAADLKQQGLSFVPEMVIKAQLSPNVEYSGRADFVVQTPRAGTIVDECKGTVSKSTRRDVIRKGEYNVSYLAQLVSYMVRLRTQKGRLVCGYYEEDDAGALVRQEERTFRVEIDDDGSIYVDSVSSGYGVADLLAHQRAAARVLETGEVAARPDKAQQKYGGPCTHCPFKAACDAYDDSPQMGAMGLLVRAGDAVKALPPKPAPVAFKIKPVRKGKTA